MLGTDGAEVSGIAIQAKQNRGAIMIQVPLDNLQDRHTGGEDPELDPDVLQERRVIQVTNESIL